MLTDSISDFLNRLKNASAARHDKLTVQRYSRMIKNIAEVLAKRGFIEKLEEGENDGRKELTLFLLPEQKTVQFKKISKPGQRIYVGYKEIKRVKSGLGLAIISTSKGVMPGEEAYKQKLGGEYICQIYN